MDLLPNDTITCILFFLIEKEWNTLGDLVNPLLSSSLVCKKFLTLKRELVKREIKTKSMIPTIQSRDFFCEPESIVKLISCEMKKTQDIAIVAHANFDVLKHVEKYPSFLFEYKKCILVDDTFMKSNENKFHKTFDSLFSLHSDWIKCNFFYFPPRKTNCGNPNRISVSRSIYKPKGKTIDCDELMDVANEFLKQKICEKEKEYLFGKNYTIFKIGTYITPTTRISPFNLHFRTGKYAWSPELPFDDNMSFSNDRTANLFAKDLFDNPKRIIQREKKIVRGWCGGEGPIGPSGYARERTIEPRLFVWFYEPEYGESQFIFYISYRLL